MIYALLKELRMSVVVLVGKFWHHLKRPVVHCTYSTCSKSNSQYNRVNNCLSSQYKIQHGTPQWCLLSLLLFEITTVYNHWLLRLDILQILLISEENLLKKVALYGNYAHLFPKDTSWSLGSTMAIM